MNTGLVSNLYGFIAQCDTINGSKVIKIMCVAGIYLVYEHLAVLKKFHVQKIKEYNHVINHLLCLAIQ